MLSDFSNWLMEIGASFDGSDFFAFIAGVLFMILWENVKAMVWNKNNPRRKLSFPKLNAKLAIYAVIVLALVGSFWSQLEIADAQRQNSAETRTIAVRTCEDNKVDAVERKALADLFLAVFRPPAEIAALDSQDPARKEYGNKLGLVYIGTIEDATLQRNALGSGDHIDPDFWERYFPEKQEPSCG